MTATSVTPHLASRLINGILAIKPLANLAKRQARQMMIKRAESIGIYWTNEVDALRSRAWEHDLAQVQKVDLNYPDYYVTSFHAYEEGNLGWQPALEVEVAAHAAHARIWKDAGAKGDAQLRQSYHNVLKAQLPTTPTAILDIGCSVGMSTFALQNAFPDAQVTGLDLSPYFLAVAKYRGEGGRQEAEGKRQKAEGESLLTTDNQQPTVPSTPHAPLPTPHAPLWLHAAAESTGLPDASFDLVSACLLFHELPQSAAIAIIREARRLLRPGGHLAIMDMNPKSEIFAKMPPYVKDAVEKHRTVFG
jgi:ubiquinone/menaquinone biosynthesis C-methylase UbiE